MPRGHRHDQGSTTPQMAAGPRPVVSWPALSLATARSICIVPSAKIEVELCGCRGMFAGRTSHETSWLLPPLLQDWLTEGHLAGFVVDMQQSHWNASAQPDAPVPAAVPFRCSTTPWTKRCKPYWPGKAEIHPFPLVAGGSRAEHPSEAAGQLRSRGSSAPREPSQRLRRAAADRFPDKPRAGERRVARAHSASPAHAQLEPDAILP